MIFIPYGTEEVYRRKRFPIVNVSLVVANVLVFAYETYLLAAFGQQRYLEFISHYAFVPASLQHSIPIGLFTAIFLHAGLLHIVGNMLFLLPFGDNVEDRMGRLKYLLFYLVCGVGANLIYSLFNMHSATPLLGASGAIAGVLGAYLALHTFGSTVKGFLFIIILLIRIRLPAIIFIGYWFIIQLFSSLVSLGPSEDTQQSGGVAFLAHVGGFIIGFLLAPLLAGKLPASNRSSTAD